MIQHVVDVGGLHVAGGVILLVEKVERVAKGVLRDDVGRVRLEDVVHLQDLPLPGARGLHPGEQLRRVLFHARLEPADAGAREVGVDRVAAFAVEVMVHGCDHGVLGWGLGSVPCWLHLDSPFGDPLLPVLLPVKKCLFVFLDGPGKSVSIKSGSLKWTS